MESGRVTSGELVEAGHDRPPPPTPGARSRSPQPRRTISSPRSPACWPAPPAAPWKQVSCTATTTRGGGGASPDQRKHPHHGPAPPHRPAAADIGPVRRPHPGRPREPHPARRPAPGRAPAGCTPADASDSPPPRRPAPRLPPPTPRRRSSRLDPDTPERPLRPGPQAGRTAPVRSLDTSGRRRTDPGGRFPAGPAAGLRTLRDGDSHRGPGSPRYPLRPRRTATAWTRPAGHPYAPIWFSSAGAARSR